MTRADVDQLIEKFKGINPKAEVVKNEQFKGVESYKLYNSKDEGIANLSFFKRELPEDSERYFVELWYGFNHLICWEKNIGEAFISCIII
jgi:hypothetical protein